MVYSYTVYMCENLLLHYFIYYRYFDGVVKLLQKKRNHTTRKQTKLTPQEMEKKEKGDCGWDRRKVKKHTNRWCGKDKRN